MRFGGPKLGLSLQQLATMGIAPPPMQPGMGTPPIMPQQPAQPKKLGMGRHIAGAIGDFLLQQAEMQPIFAPAQRERQQAEAAEAQWHRQRQAGREDKQWEWQNKPQEARAPSELERVLQASGVQPGTPQWTQAMQQRAQSLLKPDPEIIQTLPNGQLYVGPRSGLAAALTGGGTAAAPETLPPDFDFDAGGPGGSPSGAGFPVRWP